MNLSQAKDELARGIRIYKAFEFGEAVLAMLEQSEQTAKEHEADIIKFRKEAETLKEQNASAKERLLRAMGEAEKVLADARSDAQAMKDEAAQAAALLNAKADRALADILDETSAHRLDAKAASDELLAKLKDLAALEDKIEAAKKYMKTALAGL